MRAVVFGGADIKDYSFCKKYIENSFVVCCDSGMRHARALGIIPDAIVGDFDSADKETIDYFKAMNIPTVQLPTHKDETDMEIGAELAIQKGADELVIIGGIGSRLDHTMGNCNMLIRLCKEGKKAVLVNENNAVWVTDSRIELTGRKGNLVSFFPVGITAEGVTTENLEYPLENAVLSAENRLLAVSNVMLGEKAAVSVKKGMLYVMQCRD